MTVLHRPTFERRMLPPEDYPYVPKQEPPEAAAEPPTGAKRNRLDEIAIFVRALTYGEMIELASALWSLKPDGEISQEMLPGMLHKWSEGRQ